MEKFKLLTRDNFREKVFTRDEYKCVVCKEPAKDAHHILERRLFSDGGYYLENGASLCEKHHIEAETTILDCRTIRELCGITSFPLPDYLYPDYEYDKWGNILLPNGTRIKGDLFYDESVQKILEKGNVLSQFTKYVKYPRTHHLPWSNLLKDDKFMPSTKAIENEEVIVTLKMDGENTTMYNDYIHARSLDSSNHPSRNWVKGLWAQFSYMLDDNMRLCGENLYAVHSLRYENLKSYFYMFSFWIDNECLSWDETEEYAKILGLYTVPVIYRGPFDQKAIEEAFKPYSNTNEGYVIRVADSFKYSEFRHKTGKFVKPEFRQLINNSHGNWISKKIEVNGKCVET